MSAFQVLFALHGSDDWQPIKCEPFATGREAAQEAAALKAQHGATHRYKVKKLDSAQDDSDQDDNAWREREERKFHCGEYIAVPWHGCSWNDELRWEHFAHMSLTQRGKIAFTETPEKGRADRQTIMAPGRYLTRYFSEQISAQQIEAWASEAAVSGGACELHFTDDADEIQEVYENGPGSCMSGSADDYSGHCHPVRVYAGPDLQLAYCGTLEQPTGRAIVWPARKVYSSQYGDCSRMRLLLQNAGYTSGSLCGARVRRILDRNSGQYIMPYVDGISYACDDGEYIRLGDGNIETHNTDGLGGEEDDRPVCQHCDDRYDQDDGSYIEDREEDWCSSCTSNYATYCDLSGYYLSDSRNTFVEVYDVPSWGGGPLRQFTASVRYLDDQDDYTQTEDGDWVSSELVALAHALQSFARDVTHLRPNPDDQLELAWIEFTQAQPQPQAMAA
jgi:hypothetical protein